MENNKKTSKKAKLKNKIDVLLAKTTDNGASENEAMLALKKANELMMDYYLEYGDILEIKENEIIIKEYIIISGYNKFTGWLNDMGALFNVKIFYNTIKNKTRLKVIGITEDVDLALYFIDYIMRVMEVEYEKFQYTLAYVETKLFTKISERTIKSNWIKGFKYGVSDKLHDIYEERMNHKRGGEYGLICVQIESMIKDFMKLKKMKITKGKALETTENFITDMAEQQGRNIDLNQPLNAHHVEQTNLLNKQNSDNDELKYLE